MASGVIFAGSYVTTAWPCSYDTRASVTPSTCLSADDTAAAQPPQLIPCTWIVVTCELVSVEPSAAIIVSPIAKSIVSMFQTNIPRGGCHAKGVLMVNLW